MTPLVAPVIVGRRELSPEESADWFATPVKSTVAWWLAPFDTTVSPVNDAFGGSLAPLQRSTAPTIGPVGAGTTADGVEGEVPDDSWRCNRSGQFEAAYVLATAGFCGDGATEPEEAAAAVAERATMATAPMVVGRCHHPGVVGLFATMTECTLSKSTSPPSDLPPVRPRWRASTWQTPNPRSLEKRATGGDLAGPGYAYVGSGGSQEPKTYGPAKLSTCVTALCEIREKTLRVTRTSVPTKTDGPPY